MNLGVTTELHPEDLADLKRSGLSDQTIASMGCFSKDAEVIRRCTGVAKVDSPGYCIPYQGILDQIGAPYGRWRLQKPVDKMRYVAGRGDDTQLYIPLALPSLPVSDLLVVTEGEKKAAKAVQEGIHCVGVQGVWNWCDVEHRAVEKCDGDRISESTPPIAALMDLARKYRRVLVLGDSDLLGNLKARRAFDALTKSLLHFGIRAGLAYCPPVAAQNNDEKAQKQGLDDWLIADRFLAARSLPALFRATEINREGMSDTYNAREFTELAKDQLAFSQGLWRFWNGSIWVVDDCGTRRTMMPQVADVYLADADKLRSLMSATMAPLAMVKDVPPEIGSWTSPIAAAVKELRAAAGKIKNLRGIESALTLAQSHLRVPDDAWDRDPYLLSVPNGVVDLRTSELLPPVPAQRITKMAGAIYDPCAKSEVFQKFLEQVQPDPKMRDYLQRLAGYSAVGMANEQKFFVFVGGGANGKGTYGGVTMDALGAYAVKAPMGMLAQHDAGRPRNDLAMLAGARLVSISETPENLRIDEATIKAMTGQDEISARYLHQEFFKFRPCFSPILDTNHAPRPRESGEAIWRRLVIVPWTVIIPGEMRDQHLREKLLEELPGILAWIVAGAKKYLEEGLPPTPEITESTRAHRSSCDEMGRWLECCVEHTPHSSTQSTALYEEFLSWNHAEGIELPISRRKFTERLRDEFGFEVSKSHGVMVWRGIGLRDRRTAPNTPDIHGREGLKGVSAIVEAIISSQPATVVSPVHAPVQALQRMSSGGSIVC